MKRILCMLISVCMLMCLVGCYDKTEQPQETENTDATEILTSTVSTDNQDDDNADRISLLTLEKTLHTNYEWAEDSAQALVRSENSYVTLGQESAEEFPEVAEVLSQVATMQENAMLDEFDNLVSTAREELDSNRDGFETLVSTLEVYVRRADSLVVSLLTDSYSHYGRIRNYRVFHGSNYDTKSGRELTLDEVVTVNNYLAEAVEKELNDHMWTSDFYSETAVEDYFANTPYDGFSWTMDYIGLTFYFSPGDLCDEGMMTATISFAEYPQLFNKEYLVAPTEYTVEMPLDLSFFTELDTDSGLESISTSGWFDDERTHYMDYGVYTDTDAQYYYEECYAYDLHPYYVKAADGNYVYLFCEDFEEGMRDMRLVVLSLNADGSVTKTGEMNVSPSWIADNKFIVPTDPSKLILDDAENGTEKVIFAVGNNGMPICE